MGLTSRHDHKATCDFCGFKAETIARVGRYEALRRLAAAGWDRYYPHTKRTTEATVPGGFLRCNGCRNASVGGSHDPDCYACMGTGRVKGFGHTGAVCPCMRCNTCGGDAVRYEEGYPVCVDWPEQCE